MHRSIVLDFDPCLRRLVEKSVAIRCWPFVRAISGIPLQIRLFYLIVKSDTTDRV